MNDKTKNFDKIPEVVAQMADGEPPAAEHDRSIGPKIDRAALLRTVMGDGCPVTVHMDGQ